jgi:hypothetical protein
MLSSNTDLSFAKMSVMPRLRNPGLEEMEGNEKRWAGINSITQMISFLSCVFIFSKCYCVFSIASISKNPLFYLSPTSHYFYYYYFSPPLSPLFD